MTNKILTNEKEMIEYLSTTNMTEIFKQEVKQDDKKIKPLFYKSTNTLPPGAE